MAVLVKSGGAWKAASPYVKQGGVWVRPLHVHVKQGGAWKPLWSYSWQTGTWGSCSASCGGGTQTRTATCRRSDGVDLPDAYCAGITKPATSTACNTQSCVTYSWQVGDWSTCSIPCTGGTQSRTVYCRRSTDNAIVSDAYCSADRPVQNQSCNSGIACHYGWQADSWGSASSACGHGTRSRTVVCRRGAGGSVIVADSFCPAGTKPAASEATYVCTGCVNNESSIIEAKLLQSAGQGYTYATLRAALISASGSVLGWWTAYGKAESICPWPNRNCCETAGYTYISPNATRY